MVQVLGDDEGAKFPYAPPKIEDIIGESFLNAKVCPDHIPSRSSLFSVVPPTMFLLGRGV
jgi:hypothetical protein